MKIECWVDGLFLAAPIGKTPHREFWGSYDPLPVELKSEQTLWRTSSALFYTVELRESWNESDIETMIRATVEPERSHFFTYLKLVPEIISEIAPPEFNARKRRFMEFMEQADRDIPDCYPVEFNAVLKNAYTAYRRDPTTIPVELFQHEFSVIVDVLRRMER